MKVDIGGALSEAAEPGVSRDALDRLDERVGTLHERIEAGIDDREHGYAALALPETVALGEITAATDSLPDVGHVFVVGIGGSALGAATACAALPTDADLHVLDNVDPAATGPLLDDVPLADAAVVVVSRSGTTAETLANFLVVREAFEDEGVDWTDRTLVVTGDDGPLASLSDEHALPSLPVPTGVPGRYSLLSTVGLAPAALAGANIEALVAGGREGRDALSGSLYDCPAYAYGAVAYALDSRGASVNAMMPYAEGLERFAEWFAQLWAESLGKNGIGQIPQRALGATDQHSQLQLYRDGPAETMLTVVRPQERPSLPVPDPDHEALSYLEETDLGRLLDAEYEATAASMTAANRPAVRIEIDAVDAHSLGRLCYDMEAACILAGELYGIDPFVQPAVEWGKRAARGLLRGESTAETKTVTERDALWIDGE